MAVDADANENPPFRPPFGHAIPNWDFEIAENPKPGQYRYLQFAWKATSKQTKGMALTIGQTTFGMRLGLHAGEYKPTDGVVPKKVANQPPTDWEVVRVDLWDTFKKPIRVQMVGLSSRGGGAAFDQIVLGRTEKDLPAAKK
jgi:hypothetical protein